MNAPHRSRGEVIVECVERCLRSICQWGSRSEIVNEIEPVDDFDLLRESVFPDGFSNASSRVGIGGDDIHVWDSFLPQELDGDASKSGICFFDVIFGTVRGMSNIAANIVHSGCNGRIHVIERISYPDPPRVDRAVDGQLLWRTACRCAAKFLIDALGNNEGEIVLLGKAFECGVFGVLLAATGDEEPVSATHAAVSRKERGPLLIGPLVGIRHPIDHAPCGAGRDTDRRLASHK